MGPAPESESRLAVRTNTLQLLSYAALSASVLVVPLYARDLGASLEFIGWIGAAYGFASVVSNVVFGRLGDRVDRRRLLLWGFWLSALGYTFQFLASDPWSLLVLRFLVGLVSGILPATLVAYVYEMKRPLGKFTSYNSFGWLAGSGLVILAGAVPAWRFGGPVIEAVQDFLVDAGPLRVLFVASGAACAVAWWLARPLPPMRVALDVPRFPARVIAHNAHVYLGFTFRHVGASAIWAFFPLYVLQLGGDLAFYGWMHAANMVAQVVVFRRIESVRRLANARVLVVIGLALSALTFLGYGSATNHWQLIPLQFLIGTSYAFLWLGSLKEVLARSPERATAGGLVNASLSLSRVVGPAAGGLFVAAFGFRALMFAAAASTLLGVVAFFALARLRPPVAVPDVAGPRPVGDVAP